MHKRGIRSLAMPGAHFTWRHLQNSIVPLVQDSSLFSQWRFCACCTGDLTAEPQGVGLLRCTQLTPSKPLNKTRPDVLGQESAMMSRIRRRNPVWPDFLINAKPFGADRVNTCALLEGSEETTQGWASPPNCWYRLHVRQFPSLIVASGHRFDPRFWWVQTKLLRWGEGHYYMLYCNC